MAFSSVLASLQVPPEFNRYKDIPETDVIARLDEWKNAALQTLRELQTRIQQETSLPLPQEADIVSAASVFDGDDDWVTSESRSLAEGEFILFYFLIFITRVRYFT